MEQYKITIVNLENNVEQSFTVDVDEAETTDDIMIKMNVFGTQVVAINEGYFSAFQEFRDKLLFMGYGIKCKGALVNAVQSGIMWACDKIYLVEIGKQALMKDIVHIWDYVDINEFPDTKQQTEFFERWTKR